MNDLITIERDEATVKVFKDMISEDWMKAYAARQAFAGFLTQPILDIIESYPVLQQFFKTFQYDYGTPSTIPLTPLWDIRDPGFFRVWAQSRPGGLATHNNYDVSELPVMTYQLQSAIAFPLNYIRAARVDVVAAYIEHLLQNFLVKTEANSFAVMAAMIAQNTYVTNNTTAYQVQRARTQGTVIPQDISRLVTLMARVNGSWVGGTPQGASRAITHLVGSPEFAEQLRNMAFTNVNTNGVAIPSSDKFRDDLYDASGNISIYGMEIVVLNQFGLNQAYNIAFAAAAGSRAYTGYNQTGTATFSPGSEQVVFGLDQRQKGFARLVENNPDVNSTLSMQTDNQFSNRAEEIGYWMKMREGRIGVEGRGAVSLIW